MTIGDCKPGDVIQLKDIDINFEYCYSLVTSTPIIKYGMKMISVINYYSYGGRSGRFSVNNSVNVITSSMRWEE